MKLFSYNYLMIRLKRLSSNLTKNYAEICDIKRQLESQNDYYMNIDVEKVKQEIKNENLTIKELLVLRDFLREADKFQKNQDQIKAVLVGEYEKIKTRRFVYTDRVLKKVLTISLLGTIALASLGNKKNSVDSKEIPVGIEIDDEDKTFDKTGEVVKDDSQKENNEKTPNNTTNENSDNNNDRKEDNTLDNNELNTSEDVEDDFSLNNNDEKNDIDLNNEQSNNNNNKASAITNKPLNNEERNVEDNNNSNKSDNNKDKTDAIINNDTIVNNIENTDISSTGLSDEEIDKLIEGAGKVTVIGTPEDIQDELVEVTPVTESTLPEVKNEDYGNEIVYEIPASSESFEEKELEDRDEQIIIIENDSKDLELPSIDDVNTYIDDDYVDFVYDIFDEKTDVSYETINETKNNIIETEEETIEDILLDSEDELTDNESEVVATSGETLVEKGENIVIVEESTDSLPSLDMVDENVEDQIIYDIETDEESVDDILSDSEEIVDEQETIEEENINYVYEDDEDYTLPTLVEEEDGSFSNINTLSLSLR